MTVPLYLLRILRRQLNKLVPLVHNKIKVKIQLLLEMRVFYWDGQKRKLALFFWDRGSVKYQTDKETTEANLFDGCSIFLEAQVIQLGQSIGSTFSDIYRWISSTLPQCHQNKRCNNMQTNPSHGTKCPCPHQRVWIPQVPLETINGQQCFIRAPNILSKEKCIR